MPPAARVTDMHVCPMLTGPVPHVGGPILPPGAPTVLIGFLPAATVTNMATCVGPPDVIVKGSAGVFITGLPAARVGDLTTHGGVIVTGEMTVMIGEIGAPSPGAAGAGGIMAGLASSLGLDGAVKSLYGAENAFVKKLAEFGAHHLAGNKKLQKWLADRPASGTQKFFDGQVIGRGCTPSDPGTAATAPGIRPAKCQDPGKTIPKVYFANGINTKLYGDGASMCATMQKIADKTCAEVVGIYGAAEGTLPDVNQAMQEIKKESNSAQAKTLAALMTDSASSNPPQDLNLIVHSRGGLATQEALVSTTTDLKYEMSPAEVSAALSHINIAVYGTAEQGWPSGPTYTKLNNTADPIPAIIQGAQKALHITPSMGDDKTVTQHINDPQLNPIGSHSLDNVYSKYMVQAPGARDCDCS